MPNRCLKVEEVMSVSNKRACEVLSPVISSFIYSTVIHKKILFVLKQILQLTTFLFRYKIVLDTDDKMFGGRGRNQSSLEFFSQMHNCDNRSTSIVVSSR